MMSHPFQGEGDPLQTQGEGAYQSVTSTKERGSQGVGGRDESPKEGLGVCDESSKREDKEGGGLHQSQQRGGVGGFQLWPFKTQYLLRRF